MARAYTEGFRTKRVNLAVSPKTSDPIAVLCELCKEDQLDEALQIAYQSSEQGVPLSEHVIHCLQQASFTKKDLNAARQVHTLLSRWFEGNTSLEAQMIRVYALCGSLHDANTAFSAISNKTIDTWNAIISVHAKLGDGESTLQLYKKMQQEGVKLTTFTYMCILKSCTSTGHLRAFDASAIMDQHGIPVSKNILSCLLQGCLKNHDLAAGRHVYSLMVNAKLDSNSFLGDHLIRLFTTCGSLQEATQVFRKITKPSIYTWTAIISAHVKLGEPEFALHLYHEMLQQGITANNIVLLCMLKACGSIGALELGRIMHGQIMELELERDVLVGNTLVDVYAKCGSLEEAHKLFDKLSHRDVVSWGALITGYAQRELGLSALELYGKLKRDGIIPSKVIFLCTLKACRSVGSLTNGWYVHNHAIFCGYNSDVNIGSTLVDMYAKCGSLEEASKVFNGLPNRTIVSWGAIIGGFAHHSHSIPALFLYERMREQGLVPNRVIFLSVMKACGSIGASKYSRLIHDQVVRSGIVLDVVVGSTLVDMYAKCERPAATRKVFKCLPEKNLVSWSAMVGAYARVGKHVQAEACLEDMRWQGFEPDNIILSSVLTAYSHAGLLEEGRDFFWSLIERYKVPPGVSHFNCMIDLLCRSGCFDEAEDMIASMQLSPDMVGWKALISGCRAHGNVKLGRHCFDELVEIDPNDAAGYVLMSNICAGAFVLNEAYKIRVMRKFASAIKKPGTAWIEVGNQVHEFLVGFRSNDSTDSKIKQLHRCLMSKGYFTEFSLVLESIPLEEKKGDNVKPSEKFMESFNLSCKDEDYNCQNFLEASMSSSLQSENSPY